MSGLSGPLKIFKKGSNSVVRMKLEGVANGADTSVPTISNAVMGQATTYTLTDPGTSTANIMVSNTTGGTKLTSAAIVAGTTQTRAGATAITTPVVSVTVGNASDGVVLPAAVVGAVIYIVNVSNAAGKIYAAGSDTVNLTAGATGVALVTGSTTGTVTVAVCASAASWTLK